MVSQTLHYDIANVLLKTPSPPQTHNQHVHYIKKISFTLHFWLLLRNLLPSHNLLENKKEIPCSSYHSKMPHFIIPIATTEAHTSMKHCCLSLWMTSSKVSWKKMEMQTDLLVAGVQISHKSSDGRFYNYSKRVSILWALSNFHKSSFCCLPHITQSILLLSSRGWGNTFFQIATFRARIFTNKCNCTHFCSYLRDGCEQLNLILLHYLYLGYGRTVANTLYNGYLRP